MLRRLFLTLSFGLLLAACAPKASPLPSPTATFRPLVPATSTPEVLGPISTTTFTPELPTLAMPTAGPEFTSTFEPTLLETEPSLPTSIPKTTAVSTAIPTPSNNSGVIQFYGPGPQSKIISPLVMYGYAIPGYKRKGQVDLYGEDGRVLASEMLQLNTSYKWAYFYWPLPFFINSAGELGRLTLTTQDQYGRMTAANSIHLLLFSEGASILYPPGDLDLMERCTLETPAQGEKVSGGTLTVQGKMLPFNNLPLTVSLIGRDGSMLNSQMVPINPDGANRVPFRIDIPYSLDKGTWELLSVSQFDDRIGGLMYLYSQEVFLNP
jgi:hypothetical protein